MTKKEFILIAGEQTRILETDKDMALKSLVTLIATPEKRKSAMTQILKMFSAESAMTHKQKTVLARISKILQSS